MAIVHVQMISFCLCIYECLLKNINQRFKINTLVTLDFKLKVVAIFNKFDLGDI